MDFSRRAGIKTSSVLKNIRGELATVINQKHACLMEFMDGKIMHKQALADSLVIEVAEETAKMDMALKNFKDEARTRQEYEFDIKYALTLEKFVGLLPKNFNQEIFRKIFIEFREIKSEFLKMPSGLIHNDIVPHNWLVRDGKLNGLIDFSDMVFSPYIQNIAVALHLIAFAHNWNPGQAKLFIKKYGAVNPLSGQELGLLYILIKVRMLQFVIVFNRWNREDGIDQQRVEAVNDNYEFLKRFIDLGQEEFNKLIDI
jgi:Ser/Thr protein kinase RdoA (MazF antagonist)